MREVPALQIPPNDGAVGVPACGVARASCPLARERPAHAGRGQDALQTAGETPALRRRGLRDTRRQAALSAQVAQEVTVTRDSGHGRPGTGWLAHSETVRFAPSQSVALRQPPSALAGVLKAVNRFPHADRMSTYPGHARAGLRPSGEPLG
jgi:hypothetical protein